MYLRTQIALVTALCKEGACFGAEEAVEKSRYLFEVPLFCNSFCQTKPQSVCQQDRQGGRERV